MGNTVVAAQATAADITRLGRKESGDGKVPANHPVMTGEPPPECPMHQKRPPEPAGSGCPVNHDQINPLNMVSKAYN